MTSEQDTALVLPVLRDLTYREIHAFIDGLYCGIHGITNSDVDKTTSSDDTRQNEYQIHDYTQEQHYWRAGWIVGDLYNRLCR